MNGFNPSGAANPNSIAKRPRAPGAGKRLTPAQQQALLEYFLTRHRGKGALPGHGLTDAQIAARLNIAPRTLARYKAIFIERSPELAGQINGSVALSVDHLAAAATLDLEPNVPPNDPPTPALRPGPKVLGGEGLSVTLPDGPISIDAMLRVLSEMALAGPPQYRVQAVKLLDELQAAHRPVETFGPPAPLTEEDRITRLTVLMEVCGRKVADAAYARLWGPDVQTTVDETPLAEAHPQAAQG